ncbi:hypothetical protein HPP92_021389 [Vanilla planifolia]|uniref:Uncharacterized protein n=1 Tax=Vanilla planifolia TaxID=51239 RepID=A0A835Q1G6_VANPL|nr:hypothetical protein HPP92_021389 [Vanilla planifolia]
MEGKQLDLDAPLLSLRRIAATTAADDAVPPLPLRRSVVPFYNSDLKSGPVGNPAVVPFVWEKTPGQPKVSSFAETAVDWNWTPPKLPPGRSLKNKGAVLVDDTSFISQSKSTVENPAPITCLSSDCNENCKIEDEDEVILTDGGEDDAFSDARDAFSCNESFSARCSMSVGTGSRDPLRGFLKDQQTKEFMMDRFLPAAHAMAADCPQRIGWKPPRPPVEDSGETESMTTQRRRLPLDYQYQLRIGELHVKDEEDEDQEEYVDEHGTYPGVGIFSSKACGLIPRFCLKSTFGLLPAPGRKLQGRHVPRTNIKGSTQVKVLRHSSVEKSKEENSWEAVYRYKLNHGYYQQKGSGSKLTSESNQLTSCSDSQILDCSSFLNSAGSTLSFDELESTEKEKCTWKTGSIFCEKDFRSCCETEVPAAKFNSAGIAADAKAMRNSTGDSSTVEGIGGHVLINNEKGDFPLVLEVEMEKNDKLSALSLFPPPPPKSPSESWLKQTLPSISSKRSQRHSILGIQSHPKNHVPQASIQHHKLDIGNKTSNTHTRRARFAEDTNAT